MIIADTDFLSSFFKIGRIDLIFVVFKTKNITITGAVLHELEQAPFYDQFLEILSNNKIVVCKVESTEFFSGLGSGETESISLADKTNSVLLMNDQYAVRTAKQKGIIVMDIPTFLLLCKKQNILKKAELKKIIEELKEKDFYLFTDDINNKLLQ